MLQVVVTGECVHKPPPATSLPPNPTPAEVAAAAAAQPQNFISIDPTTGAGFTINNPGEGRNKRLWEGRRKDWHPGLCLAVAAHGQGPP